MRQTAIWIDHDEARVFHVEGDTLDKDTIHAAHHHLHRHPHPQDEARFFDGVLALLAGSEELLLMGPSVTKLHLLRYAQGHAPAVAERIVGLETADHPTDRQLVAHMRHYFHTDRPRQGVPAS